MSRGVLRPESKSLVWTRCDESQKEAIHRLVNFLTSALCELDEHIANPNDLNAIHSFYEDAVVNRTCLLSGERGTGKTSVLKTLFRITQNTDVLNEFFGEEIHSDRKVSELAESIQKLKSRLGWLDPIDMEVLPGPSNLLAAILCRIEEQVKHDLGSESVLRVPLFDLRELMQDVTLAWDGNMPERGEHVDPDTYASEVIRAERARVSIPDRVAKVLKNLKPSGPIKHKLYVLPIDDFDMSPTRCLELLRLVRMLNVPQLFTIVLGSIHMTSEILQVKMTGDFAGVAKIRLEAKDLAGKIHQKHRKLASESLRKLVPLHQRIELRKMHKEEALQFLPFSQQASQAPKLRTLLELLDAIKLNLSRPVFSERDSVPLSVFFLGCSGRNRVPKQLTTSAGVLVAAPRELSDLWFQLNKLASENITNGEAIELAKSLLEESLGIQVGEFDGANLAERLIESYPHDGQKSWAVNAASCSLKLVGYQSRLIGNSIEIVTGGNWEISFSNPIDPIAPESKRKRELFPMESTPTLALLHDLAITHQPVEVHSRGLIPNQAAFFARPVSSRLNEIPGQIEHGANFTTADSSLRLPWPLPKVNTFVELDFLVERWRQIAEENDGWFQANAIAESEGEQQSLLWWIVHLSTFNLPLDIREREFSEISMPHTDGIVSLAVKALSKAIGEDRFDLGTLTVLAPEFRLWSVPEFIAQALNDDLIRSKLLDHKEQMQAYRGKFLADFHKASKNKKYLLRTVYPFVIHRELWQESVELLGEILPRRQDKNEVKKLLSNRMIPFEDLKVMFAKIERSNITKPISFRVKQLIKFVSQLRTAYYWSQRRNCECVTAWFRIHKKSGSLSPLLRILDLSIDHLVAQGVPKSDLQVASLLEIE